MNQNDSQTALNTLISVKESLLEDMVAELIQHQHDEASSFSLQEIEDRFAIRLANLNTLIATLQDQIENCENANHGRVVVVVEECNRQKLEKKIDEMIEFISPEELLQISVTPLPNGKFMIVLARGE